MKKDIDKATSDWEGRTSFNFAKYEDKYFARFVERILKDKQEFTSEPENPVVDFLFD